MRMRLCRRCMFFAGVPAPYLFAQMSVSKRSALDSSETGRTQDEDPRLATTPVRNLDLVGPVPVERSSSRPLADGLGRTVAVL
jgi:hypothetical protein